jgi:hypothetical protein
VGDKVKKTIVPIFALTLLPVLVCSCNSAPDTQRNPTTHNNSAATTSRTPVSDPPDFLYFTTNGTVESRSPTTGALIKVVTHVANLTNNGASLSTDGSNAYVAVIAKSELNTKRIRIQTGTVSLAVDGIEAAVSGNGELLAYTPGPNYTSLLSVNDLKTNSTSTINLESLLGSSTNLMNATITWLGDGSDIVVMPGGNASATSGDFQGSGRTLSSNSNNGTCSASLPHTSICLLLVHFAGPGRPLTAHRVLVNGIGGNLNVVSGAQGQQHTLALAVWGENTAVYRVTFAGSRPEVTHLASLGFVLPEAFDALGTHLLYVVGHGPVALWVTGFNAGHLVDSHKLLDSTNMSEVVW